jgi:hypothetical protein
MQNLLLFVCSKEDGIFSTNIPNTKFYKNPSSGRRVKLYEQIDGYENASSHFSQIICIRRFKTKQFINCEDLRKGLYAYVLYYYYYHYHYQHHYHHHE